MFSRELKLYRKKETPKSRAKQICSFLEALFIKIIFQSNHPHINRYYVNVRVWSASAVIGGEDRRS
jgi:hypothetical protein